MRKGRRGEFFRNKLTSEKGEVEISVWIRSNSWSRAIVYLLKTAIPAKENQKEEGSFHHTRFLVAAKKSSDDDELMIVTRHVMPCADGSV